jgi:type IV secretory pathway VirB4 component
MADNKKPKIPTQQYIDIAEIHDNTVIMKDNTLVAVLMISSINFALKSEEEQNAIVQAYISFINSLDFPVQIVIQSRKLNINNYLDSLKIKEKEQTNELLKIQIREYTHYIKELVELGDITSKKFYVVVHYNLAEGTKRQGVVSKILNSFKIVKIVNLKREKFLKYRQELDRRLGVIQGGLSSMMLNSQQLDTQSLIELYYNSYNPEVSERQKMEKVEKLRVE